MAVSVAAAGMPMEGDSEAPIIYQNNNLLHEEYDQSSSDTATEMELLPDSYTQMQPSELEERLRGYEILHARRVNLSATDDEMLSIERYSPESASAGEITTPINHDSRTSPSQSPGRSRWLWGGLLACIHPVAAYLRKDLGPQVKKDKWEIPFADIRELEFIGSGSQGAVFVGEYRGDKVAVKKVKDPSYCEEIRHLRKLKHPNIVVFK